MKTVIFEKESSNVILFNKLNLKYDLVGYVIPKFQVDKVQDQQGKRLIIYNPEEELFEILYINDKTNLRLAPLCDCEDKDDLFIQLEEATAVYNFDSNREALNWLLK